MKRNLFPTVALITMLSVGASSAVANQDTTERFHKYQQNAAELWASFKDGAELSGKALVAFYVEHKDQILNRALPAVLTVVAGVFLIKTWPAAAPVQANGQVAAAESVNPATPETPQDGRRRTPRKNAGKRKSE